MAEFYFCKNFKDSIVNDSGKEVTEKKIDSLKNRKDIETLKTNTFERYAKEIYILKITSGHNIRVVFQIYFFSDIDTPFFFAREYVPSRKYEPYWRKQIEPNLKNEKWLKTYPLPPEEIEDARKKYFEKINAPKPELPPIPDSYNEWLNFFKLKIKFNIFESENWVKAAQHITQINLAYINKLIQKLIKNDLSNIEIIPLNETHRNLKRANYVEENVCIIYEEAEIFSGETEKGNYKIIFLHGGGNTKTQSDEILKLEKLAKNFEGLNSIKNKNYNLKNISNCAYKAYPFSALMNIETWLTIQSNKETSNLSLSPEQINLLEKYVFPKFVNGQAGSGKSTMLYYLFADICFRKLLGPKGFEKESFDGCPLFLTENYGLLTNTKLAVKELLKCNSEYSEQVREFSLDINTIDNYFYSFHYFLYKKLLPSEYSNKFNPEKFIRYSKFKEFYKESKIKNEIKKRYPPEVVWYVISTFIKGYDFTKFVDIDYFTNEIPKRDRSQIDNNTFIDIYNEIWVPFYKKLWDNGNGDYWDRLDLVRFILDKFESLPIKYTVIFCDEAQDFTKIELELIIKLSVFTGYNLSEQQQVPITFAGDPFQTVNPTGFNLAKVKRLFHQELTSKFKFNRVENDLVADLNCNYRSSKPIVDFANAIQFCRYKYLNNKDIAEPQEAKQSGDRNLPLLFNLNDSKLNKENLREKLKYDIIILPCDDGEEEIYCTEDSWLDQKSHVKSAIGVKGSEYGQVIIYKYGEYFLKSFGVNSVNLLLNNEFEKQDDGSKFKTSFFFNKLYVAVTRAQKRLIIIDTERGLNEFWKLFTFESLLKDILQEKNNWADINIKELYEIGNESDLVPSDKGTAILNAERDKTKGNLFKDPYLMKCAAKYYDHVGEENESTYCWAKSMEFAGEYKKAGEKFEIINKIFDASNCYWKGQEWNSLIDLLKNEDDRESRVRVFIAKVMSQEEFNINEFCDLSEVIGNSLISESISEEIGWKHNFYNKLCEIINIYIEGYDEQTCSKLARNIEKITEDNEEIYKIIAKCYFKAKMYTLAVDFWNKTREPYYRDYFIAQLDITDDNNAKVIYLKELEWTDQLLKLYDSDKKSITDPKALNIIFKENINKNKFITAFEIEPDVEKILNYISGDVQKHRLLLFDIKDYIKDKSQNEISKIVTPHLIRSVIGILIELPKPLPNQKTRQRVEKNAIEKNLMDNKFSSEIIENLFYILAYSEINYEEYNKETLKLLEQIIFIYIEQEKIQSNKSFVENEIICYVLESICVDYEKILKMYEMILQKNLTTYEKSKIDFLAERWCKVRFKIFDYDLKEGVEKLEDKNLKIIEDKIQRDCQSIFLNQNFEVEKLSINTIMNLPEFPIFKKSHIQKEKDHFAVQEQIPEEKIITIVKKLQSQGMDYDQISNIVDLSPSQIRQILN